MAKLSDFLGGLASGICDARVNSDIQSIRIAEEYAKNDLLKHFAVPRMRINSVELNIPVAVNNLIEKTQRIYYPINSERFTEKTYQQILSSLGVTDLESEVTSILKKTISDSIRQLEAKISINQAEYALADFSNNIGTKTIDLADLIIKRTKNKKLSKVELTKLKTIIIQGLQTTLKGEIQLKEEKTVLDAVDVIVESDKLREIKAENVIMIKMTISEHGMEWIKMEDKDGNIVNQLMPE